jgi:hypothetical protein
MLDASAELHAVTDERAQEFLGADVNAPLATDGAQLIAGTVTWRKPPTSEGSFSIYLIDKRTHLKPPYMEASNRLISVGANSWDSAAADKYAWLKGAGMIHRNGVWVGGSCELELSVASGLTSAAFVAVFPDGSHDALAADHATAPVDVADLLVGLVFVGGDSQIDWAQRLLG